MSVSEVMQNDAGGGSSLSPSASQKGIILSIGSSLILFRIETHHSFLGLLDHGATNPGLSLWRPDLDFAAELQVLLQNRSNPILSAFFEQSYFVLRAEVNRVPINQQTQFPRFAGIADLLAEFRQGKTNPAFQTALACIFQLGTFIRQYGESGRAYPLPAETFLVGLCTGALAAAAISSSSSLSELLPAAIHTVVISFRLGLCVADVGNRIEPESSSNWSTVFPGVPAQRMLEILEDFCKENSLSPTSRPWISAHVTNGVTVSGPPSILERFQKSAVFKTTRTRTIPIRVPAHTSHLFTVDDVNSILDTTSLREQENQFC